MVPNSFPASGAACWHSHFTLLRKIADGDDDVVLIFEDDIDMEWDLEKRLRYLWQFLPDNAWDQVMIGQCAMMFGKRTRAHSYLLAQGIANPTKTHSRQCQVIEYCTHPSTLFLTLS